MEVILFFAFLADDEHRLAQFKALKKLIIGPLDDIICITERTVLVYLSCLLACLCIDHRV